MQSLLKSELGLSFQGNGKPMYNEGICGDGIPLLSKSWNGNVLE